eukprot:10966330-Alexandrium_andersonii.AAC.1
MRACLLCAVERAAAGGPPASVLRRLAAGLVDTGRLLRAARLGAAVLTWGTAPGSTTSDAERLGGACTASGWTPA